MSGHTPNSTSGAPLQPGTRQYLAPPEVNARLSRVEELLRRPDKQGARAVLAEVAPYAVKNVRYWKLVARAARHKGDALDALQQALKVRPNDEEALTMLRRLDKRLADDMRRGEAGSSAAPARRPLRQRALWTSRTLLFALIAAAVVTLTVLVLLTLNGVL